MGNKNVTSLLEDILEHVQIHQQINMEKKGYFKVNSKLAENSRNHIFYIFTTLGLVLQIVFQICLSGLSNLSQELLRGLSMMSPKL